MAYRFSLRKMTKMLLKSIIAALTLSAVVGIYIFIVGDFGDTEMRILITTLSVAYFSLTALGCAVVLERRRALWLAICGLITSPAGFVWSQLMIWAGLDNDFTGKTMLLLGLWAFSFAQGCLLTLAPLAGRWRYLFAAALGCIFTLAALLSVMVVFDLEDELLFRMVGVVGILDAGTTLAVPIAYKLGGGAAPVSFVGPPEATAWQIELVCPRCNRRGVYPAGVIRCPECSLEIRLSVCQPRGDQPPKRFQFTLKTALVVFLLTALPLGWIAFRLQYLAEQRAVVARLRSMDVLLNYRYNNVHSVAFWNTAPSAFDPSVLADIAKLETVRLLDLSGMPVQDEHLLYLRGTKIANLDLSGTAVTDAGLAYLELLPELRYLDVTSTAVSEEALMRLERRVPHLYIDH